MALLLGGVLLVVVLACIIPLFVVRNVDDGTWQVLLMLSVVAALSCGVGPFVSGHLRNTRYVVVALAVLDLLPLVMTESLSEGTPARQWSSLLLIPVLITAATLPPRLYRAELIAACVIGALIMIRPMASVVESLLSCIGFTLFMVICASLTRQDRTALDLRFAQWQRRSRTDELTGLLNRRGFVAEFSAVRRSCVDLGAPVGVLMIDIDHFSRINARYGHAYGDLILQRICAVVSNLPELAGGLIARIGGEELIVVVPRPAEPVAVALQAQLERAGVHPGLTVSMGICDADPRTDCADPEAMWRLVTVADQAMYRAKELGRNRHVRGHPGDTRAQLPAGRRPIGDMATRQAPRWTPAPQRPPQPLPGEPVALDPTEPTDYRLFGCYCFAFAAIGLVAWARPIAVDPQSRWVPVFLFGLITMALLGLLAVFRGPRTPPFVTVVSCVAIELCTLSAVLATPKIEQRLMVICILTVPVLVSAHALPLPWLGGQVLLVFVGAGLAANATDHPVDAEWMHRTLGLAAVLCAAPGVLFWLRQRRERASAQLRRLVAIDPLTGVYNRTGLQHEVLRDTGDVLHVQAFNIRGFKWLNDTYGHVFGDEVLVQLANTLAGALTTPGGDTPAGPEAPMVGRTGGDRFVVIDRHPPSPALTDRLHRAVGSFPAAVSVSMGAADGPVHDVADLWSLIGRAEAAVSSSARPARTAPGRPAPDQAAPDPTGPGHGEPDKTGPSGIVTGAGPLR